MNAESKVGQTIQDRGAVYGEPHLSHENIGLCWTAAIQQHFGIKLPAPIPPEVVELMMAQFKIQRAMRVFHEDNYVDVRAYLQFAEHRQANPGKPFVTPPVALSAINRQEILSRIYNENGLPPMQHIAGQ